MRGFEKKVCGVRSARQQGGNEPAPMLVFSSMQPFCEVLSRSTARRLSIAFHEAAFEPEIIHEARKG